MGVTIQATEVEETLQAAYDMAATAGDALIQDEALRGWCDRVRHFQQSIVPKTYLPVVTTMLAAKAMHGDGLDVTLLQTRAGPKPRSTDEIGRVSVP